MADLFKPCPPPESPLAYYRVMSPRAGVKVSPLCLGTMNFGESWKALMGECSQQTANEIMDYFYEQGGNFLDTSNNYQDEESEQWIGEWMEKRGNRDQLVIATKYTSPWRQSGHEKIKVNHLGNSSKSLLMSVDASLKKLRTSYIDVLYVHWWEFTTSVEEMMQSLNRLVQAGKVLYLGASDVPAWIVSKANQYARDHGLAQFVIYQGLWNAAVRDFERECLPMALAEGMAIAPWGALGRGNFKAADAQADDGRKMGGASDNEKKVAAVLEAIAKRKGTLITSVAMAYVMTQAPDTYPIVGGRKVEHLKGNIDALKVRLSPEDIEEIQAAIPFDHGFPIGFFSGGSQKTHVDANDVILVRPVARLALATPRGPALAP